MISAELLKILRCPETHQWLALADAVFVQNLNQKIATRGLRNRGGQIVPESMEAALIREDRSTVYPVRKNMPILLVDEAILLQQG